MTWSGSREQLPQLPQKQGNGARDQPQQHQVQHQLKGGQPEQFDQQHRQQDQYDRAQDGFTRDGATATISLVSNFHAGSLLPHGEFVAVADVRGRRGEGVVESATRQGRFGREQGVRHAGRGRETSGADQPGLRTNCTLSFMG